MSRLNHARHVDLIEYVMTNSSVVKAMRAQRRAEEKSIAQYLVGACTTVAGSVQKRLEKRRMTDEERKDFNEKEEAKRKEELAKIGSDDSLRQYYQSQDLLKTMKWKRVNWDADADYEAFSRRIQDNSVVFNKTPAFSFLCLHLKHDPHAPKASTLSSNASELVAGSLTTWLFEEREPEVVPKYVRVKPSEKMPPFIVDWVAGKVDILDSASAHEVHSFLQTTAPRLMSLQQRMTEEQEKLAEDLEKVRIRLGIHALKFNQYDRTYWDDDALKKDPDTYVTPREVNMFVESALASATLLRFYLKGNQLRITKPGTPYRIDEEAREICIPADFSEYECLRFYKRWQTFERVLNMQRTIWWFWFMLALMLIGDFEMI